MSQILSLVIVLILAALTTLVVSRTVVEDGKKLFGFGGQGLGLGMNVGGNGLDLSVKPPSISLSLGLSLDKLISPELALEIQSRPVDYSKVPACSTVDAEAFSRIGKPNRVWSQWYRDGAFTVIPVIIDERFDQNSTDVILTALNLITQNTCVRFLLGYDYITQVGLNFVDVKYTTNDDCSFNFDHKVMVLGPYCFNVGIVAHEFLHAMDFHHTQNQPDRDNYVTIVKENIRNDRTYNFEICRDCITFGAPYDYDSVMHYDAYDFNKWNDKCFGPNPVCIESRRTIVPKKAGTKIGQREGLSFWDIHKINAKYCLPPMYG